MKLEWVSVLWKQASSVSTRDKINNVFVVYKLSFQCSSNSLLMSLITGMGICRSSTSITNFRTTGMGICRSSTSANNTALWLWWLEWERPLFHVYHQLPHNWNSFLIDWTGIALEIDKCRCRPLFLPLHLSNLSDYTGRYATNTALYS